MSTLPDLPDRDDIQSRLRRIFPKGSPEATLCSNERAANVVFTFLYIGAVEGEDRYLAAKHVYRMTDDQANATSEAHRLDYAKDCLRPGYKGAGDSWYADNSREPIRDETLRQGLMAVGAVSRRDDYPTTSPKPTYAITRAFADLFDPSHRSEDLESRITSWRDLNISKDSQVRNALRQRNALRKRVSVKLPNGEARVMAPGPSSNISKAVIEEFATHFLDNPAVLWLSESRKKVVESDRELASSLGLHINEAEILPDIILVDARTEGSHVLLVFVEVVATDGPITPQRQDALVELAESAGFHANQIALVTAFEDRQETVVRRLIRSLAWNSFVWFATEPDKIVALYDSCTATRKLHNLLTPPQAE